MFLGSGLTENNKKMLSDLLGVKCVDLRVSGSDLVGLFSRANSNGMVLSNLTLEDEVAALKKQVPDMNVDVVESDLNVFGSNVLANDKIAIINPDFAPKHAREIGDILDVEVIKAGPGGFKTVGANNILTNRGFAINNRSTDEEKALLDKHSSMNSERTTANMGGFAIGLAVIANSRAVIAGESTTGYELARIVDALE